MSESTNKTNPLPGADTLDRLDELVSLLLDDAIDAESLAEMERLLGEDEDARRRYVELAQLHAELTRYYRGSKASDSKASGVVAAAIDLPGFGGDATLSSSDSAIG